jgi:hypothetical protein
MNERIKQLAEQARAEVRADWAKGNKIPYPEAHYAFQRDNDQKFAQLIVRECAEVCYDHSRAAGGVDTDFGYGYKDCGDDIKRNFGVKE